MKGIIYVYILTLSPSPPKRLLSKFGVERNQDFDLEEAFGPVTPDLDNTEETIEMHTNVNSVAFTTLNLKVRDPPEFIYLVSFGSVVLLYVF